MRIRKKQEKSKSKKLKEICEKIYKRGKKVLVKRIKKAMKNLKRNEFN